MAKAKETQGTKRKIGLDNTNRPQKAKVSKLGNGAKKTKYEGTFSEYRGRAQPPISKRLQQIINFLADEDHYHYLSFDHRLQEISEYVGDLKKRGLIDERDSKDIGSMIKVHKDWKAAKKAVTPIIYPGAQLAFQPDLDLVPQDWKPRPGLLLEETWRLHDMPKQGWAKPEKLHKSLHEGLDVDLSQDPDPFEYSNKVAAFLKREKLLWKRGRNEDIKRNENNVFHIPAPANYRGPKFPISEAELYQRVEETLQSAYQVQSDLEDAQTLAPRKLLDDVMQNARADKKIVRSDTSKPIAMTSDEINTLLLLTEPSHRTKRGTISLHTEDRGDIELFTSYLESAFEDYEFWDFAAKERKPTKDVLKYIKDNYRTWRSEKTNQWLKILAGLKRIILNEDGTIQRPLPDDHPEDHIAQKFTTPTDVNATENQDFVQGRLDQNIFRELGTRLGHWIKYLRAVETEYKKKITLKEFVNIAENEQESIRSVEEFMKNGKLEEPGFIEIAVPLAAEKRIQNLDEATAIDLLQERMLLEHSRNWEPYKPDYAKMWAFAKDLKYNDYGFNIWGLPPLHLPYPNTVKDETKDETKDEYFKEEDEEHDTSFISSKTTIIKGEPVSSSKITFIKGEPGFNLGETPIQQEYQSKQIKEDLEKSEL